ncbi:MAG: hypothetical protein AAGE43_21215 [Pseudomonadota bacterium]
MRSVCSAALFGALCLCLAVVAEADDGWEYEGELGASWRQVTERDNGERLVREEGPAAAFNGAAALRSGAWRYLASAGYFGAKLDYSGRTQFGAGLETETEWQGWHVGAGLERRFLGPVPLRLGALLAYEQRDRGIQPTDTTQGLDESYRTGWLMLNAAMEPSGYAVLSASLGCALTSEAQVSFASTFDAADVAIDDHCRAALAGEFRLRRAQGRTYFLKPYAAWERYATTESVPLSAGGVIQGALYLPGTEFLSYGLTFGVRRIR